MSGILSKTTSLLEVNLGRSCMDDVVFDQPEGLRDRTLRINREVWTDLGKPVEITVTIQPGDHLNN